MLVPLDHTAFPGGYGVENLGPWLARLFQVLNTPIERRQMALDEDLAHFPHVNGELFAEILRIPDFNASMRQALLDASRFDWTAISPAVFGALFQAVMEPSDRRAQGAHYTTEKNILKVIEPLFLDDLRAEFQKLQERRDGRSMADLRKFRDRLGTLRLFDPACGCGNFLIIAYRELRSLEIEVLREMASRTGATQLKLEVQSVVDVDQFYGIEIGEFPVRIAATALWMMDHIMNNRLSLEFGKTYARIPIEKSPHIHHGDALEIDWGEVLPPNECSSVFGNPPFGGAKFQSAGQRSQVRRIAALGGSGGTLDYIAAWFIRAGEYVRRARPENSSRPPRIGFVATNSITQGEQVAQLWPLLLDRHRLEIAFAHRTFAWGSDARGKAHVHVVIIGLDTTEHAPRDRRLFAYEDLNGEPLESRHAVITPYLFDGGALANPHLVVREESRPINAMPRLKTGVQMIDNGILTFTHEEYCDFLADEPRSLTFFRKYIGGDEYINGFHRWILYLADSSPSDLRHLPKIRERIQRVRQYRASSRRPSTIAMSAYPTKVGVDERLSAPFLVLPNTSSERREYIPIGWLTPEVIANQKLRILPDATLAHFALLTSAMHMAWMRVVTGRMKSDYMYSVGVVYNTFPTPPGFKSENASLSALEPLAQAVLDARAAHPDATLADLYDPDLMPPNLRRAHHALDRAIDRLYRRARFTSECERVEYLFALYERLQAPLTAEAAGKGKRRLRTRRARRRQST